ncbi:hypothetical protein E2C01_023638 [Portunus trituberculatus]|uniref:Uncharacterized protein n=1 Tax=Portunus trituberculatus TaxID=210409 RepID=A0A5B7EAK3_PORTR|nr:hypothetical protein [Portunus trituberculatus]
MDSRKEIAEGRSRMEMGGKQNEKRLKIDLENKRKCIATSRSYGTKDPRLDPRSRQAPNAISDRRGGTINHKPRHRDKLTPLGWVNVAVVRRRSVLEKFNIRHGLAHCSAFGGMASRGVTAGSMK